jgi:hypothetical protein
MSNLAGQRKSGTLVRISQKEIMIFVSLQGQGISFASQETKVADSQF